jgi:hypothetical protein
MPVPLLRVLLVLLWPMPRLCGWLVAAAVVAVAAVVVVAVVTCVSEAAGMCVSWCVARVWVRTSRAHPGERTIAPDFAKLCERLTSAIAFPTHTNLRCSSPI